MATQQQQIDFEVTTDNHSPPPSSPTDDNNANDTENEGTLPQEAQLTNAAAAAAAAPPPSKKSKKGTTTGSKKGTKRINQAPSTAAAEDETDAGETDGPPETTLGNIVARLCILTFLLFYVVFPRSTEGRDVRPKS